MVFQPNLRRFAAAADARRLMSSRLEAWHANRADEESFTVYVGGETQAPSDDDLGEPGVEYRMADRFELNLQYLAMIDPARPILVYMATCGGSWEAGMQMYSAILECPNPITIVATRWARSMSSIVPLAADRFYLRPPAKYMLHRGTIELTGLDQHVDTMDVERRKDTELMLRIYITRLQSQGRWVNHVGDPIRAWLLECINSHIDVWFSAADAVQVGFVDYVASGPGPVLRSMHRNELRRAAMLEVLTRPIQVTVSVR